MTYTDAFYENVRLKALLTELISYKYQIKEKEILELIERIEKELNNGNSKH